MTAALLAPVADTLVTVVVAATATSDLNWMRGCQLRHVVATNLNFSGSDWLLPATTAACPNLQVCGWWAAVFRAGEY